MADAKQEPADIPIEPADIVCSSCDVSTDPLKIFTCITCDGKNCELCINTHLRKKHVVKDLSGYSPGVCSEHNALSLYFCETCTSSACAICLSPHVTHQIKDISDEATRIRNEIHENIMKLEKAAKPMLLQKTLYDDYIAHSKKIFGDPSIPFDVEALDNAISKVLREIHVEYKKEQQTWLEKSSDGLQTVENISKSSNECLQESRDALVASDGVLVNNYPITRDKFGSIYPKIESQQGLIVVSSVGVINPFDAKTIPREKIKAFIKEMYPQIGKQNVTTVKKKKQHKNSENQQNISSVHVAGNQILTLSRVESGLLFLTMEIYQSEKKLYETSWKCQFNVPVKDVNDDIELIWFDLRTNCLLCRSGSTAQLVKVEEKVNKDTVCTRYLNVLWTTQIPAGSFISGTISFDRSFFSIFDCTTIDILTENELRTYRWNSRIVPTTQRDFEDFEDTKIVIPEIECREKFVFLQALPRRDSVRRVAFYGSAKPVITIVKLDEGERTVIPTRVVTLSVKEKIVRITANKTHLLVELENNETIGLSYEHS